MVDEAFVWLQQAILRGHLQPGERIPQDEIATSLSISRMPLREALRKLEERGFVEISPHRGATVTPLTVDQIEEIYLIRRSLESLSARRAAEQMDEKRVAGLRRILDKAQRALDTGDERRLSELNRKFHLVGHEAAGLVMLHRLISQLTDHSQRYRLIHATLRYRSEAALAEHEQILEAWARKEPDAAAYWIDLNLSNSAEAIIASSRELDSQTTTGVSGEPAESIFSR